MGSRKGRIQKEVEYMDYLHGLIRNQENQKHFRAAVDWCQPQAESYRRKYYCIKWLQAILGVVIIALGAFQDGPLGISIAIVGGISALMPFALSLHKYHDSWKRYRNNIEDIKSLRTCIQPQNLL